VLEERVGGVADIRYVWSPVYIDALVLRDRDTGSDDTFAERLYATQDANWNVTGLVDTSGAVQERYVNSPYGVVTVLAPDWTSRTTSSFGWVYHHQGGRLDAVTGLYAFRERDYSSSLGRWTSVDPKGFAAGDSNLYRANENNPINRIDPLGEQDRPNWRTEARQIRVRQIRSRLDDLRRELDELQTLRRAIDDEREEYVSRSRNLWIFAVFFQDQIRARVAMYLRLSGILSRAITRRILEVEELQRELETIERALRDPESLPGYFQDANEAIERRWREEERQRELEEFERRSQEELNRQERRR
jgi:RHS repeat-associated protein